MTNDSVSYTVTLHLGARERLRLGRLGRRTVTLALRRAPLFLRFTFAADDDEIDALDQLDDEPRAGEALVAARKRPGEPTRFFVDGTDKRGRRKGWVHFEFEYDPIEDQPGDEVMRDNAAWRTWCLEQANEGEANG